MGALINDIDIWRSVVVDGGAGQQRPRTLRQFGDLATEYLRPAPRHWMYDQGRNTNEWLAHYVNYVDYRPPERTGGANYRPGSVTISTLYWRMGTRSGADFTFRNNDTDGQTVAGALAEKGMVIETDILRAGYARTMERFDEVFDQVGRQFLASGHATSLGNTGSQG